MCDGDTCVGYTCMCMYVCMHACENTKSMSCFFLLLPTLSIEARFSELNPGFSDRVACLVLTPGSPAPPSKLWRDRWADTHTQRLHGFLSSILMHDIHVHHGAFSQLFFLKQGFIGPELSN